MLASMCIHVVATTKPFSLLLSPLSHQEDADYTCPRTPYTSAHPSDPGIACIISSSSLFPLKFLFLAPPLTMVALHIFVFPYLSSPLLSLFDNFIAVAEAKQGNLKMRRVRAAIG